MHCMCLPITPGGWTTESGHDRYKGPQMTGECDVYDDVIYWYPPAESSWFSDEDRFEWLEKEKGNLVVINTTYTPETTGGRAYYARLVEWHYDAQNHEHFAKFSRRYSREELPENRYGNRGKSNDGDPEHSAAMIHGDRMWLEVPNDTKGDTQ